MIKSNDYNKVIDFLDKKGYSLVYFSKNKNNISRATFISKSNSNVIITLKIKFNNKNDKDFRFCYVCSNMNTLTTEWASSLFKESHFIK